MSKIRDDKTFLKDKHTKFKIGQRNLKYNLNMKSGSILGKVPKKNNLLILPDENDITDPNFLIVGNAGTGKTENYVTPNILNIKHSSIVVVDTKDELKSLTSKIKEEQGYKTYELNFNGKNGLKYNPLYHVEIGLQTKVLAKNMVENSTNTLMANKFLGTSAIKILNGLIIYVKYEYNRQEATLEKVADIYDKHIQDEEHFLKWVDEEVPKDHPAYKYIVLLKELKDVTRKTVIDIINTSLNLFKLENIKSMTSKSNFDFRDFIEEKSILYVNLTLTDKTTNSLISIFLNQMLNTFYNLASESSNQKLKHNVSIFLDNFIELGRIEKYSEILATSRSIGLSMHTIIQNLAQLENSEMYNDDEVNKLLNIHSNRLILGVDSLDMKTNNWVKNMLTSKESKKNNLNEVDFNIDNNKLLLIGGYKPIKIEKIMGSEIYPIKI